MTTPAPAPVDCVLKWSAYSTCNPSSSTQTSTATVVTPAANGGAACPALTKSVACDPYVVFPGVYQTGGDISSSPMSSSADCTSLCSNNPQCVAAQYNSIAKSCSLKNAILPSSFLGRATGYTLSIQNPNTAGSGSAMASMFTGTDLSPGFAVTSADQCRRLGMLSPGVAVASYTNDKGLCFLKSNLGNSGSDPNRQSWLVYH